MDYEQSCIAEIYDLANPPGPETDFYVSLAGPRPRSVLDLGCGTGTLCSAFATRGHKVTGVDPAAAMLAVAKRKPFAQRIEWVKSCAQSYTSDRRFDLVLMTGHAFQILLTDPDMVAALATMRRHLKPHGRIGFETRNPQLDWAAEWASRPPRKLPGTQLIETLEITGKINEFISFKTLYRSPDRTLSTESTLRFPSREHLKDLISRSGLRIRNTFGDWDGTTFEPERSREIIFVAELNC
jgi:ubiquinone/menaquinone biosynthesis C-methylase UbiE